MAIVKSNFYAQELNQFAPNRVRGELLDWGLNSLQMEVAIDASESADLRAGDIVKIAPTSTGKLKVVAADGTEAVKGMIIFNAKKEVLKAGDMITIAMRDAVMNCVTEEAINAGDEVYYKAADGSITKTKATNAVRLGIAMAKVPATSGGIFIPVLLG